MNRLRRKELAALQQRIEIIKNELESLREEEEFYFENMPEGIQNSELGERSQAAIDNMEYAEGSLDEALENIEQAQA